eukprot:IDg6919t1
MSVEEDPPKRRYYPSILKVQRSKGDAISLAELNGERESVSTFTEPVESPFHSAGDIESSISQSLQEAPPDPYSEVYSVQHRLDGNRVFHRSTQDSPNKVRHSTSKPSLMSEMIVCFICFITGHRSSQCPHVNRMTNDAAFRKWAYENFTKLKEWQKMWLKSIDRSPESPNKSRPESDTTHPKN